MKIKSERLLKFSWNIGLIAFIGGWIIFLLWTAGRYAGPWEFEVLEIIGFFWMLSFFFLSLIALLLLIAYVLINGKNLHLKMLYAGLIILINIPSVLIIVPLQKDIENKVFVRLTNQSGMENIDIKLHGDLKTWDIGSINNGFSKVFNYDPPYWKGDSRLYQKPDTLNLIITQNGTQETIGFPTLRMGECKHLILGEDLKIKEQ